MLKQCSGVVLMFGGSGQQTFQGLGGFQIALDAMEGLRRQWAVELGKSGIRVVTIVTGGIIETIPWQREGRDDVIAGITDATVNISSGTVVDY